MPIKKAFLSIFSCAGSTREITEVQDVDEFIRCSHLKYFLHVYRKIPLVGKHMGEEEKIDQKIHDLE